MTDSSSISRSPIATTAPARPSTSSMGSSRQPTSTRSTDKQFLPFNTVYQLVADRRSGRLDGAAHVVLLPDLLAFWLTGSCARRPRTRRRPGSSTRERGQWSNELLARLGLPSGLLPPLQQPGEVRGRVQEELRARLGLPRVDRRHHGRLARHRIGGRGGSSRRPPLRLRLQWNVVARRAGARRADHHRSQPRRQLHQRGRRRPANAVPAQHVRSVAAAGIDAGLGRSRPTTGPDGAARRRRRVAGGRPADRRRRPGVHPAWEDAGAHRSRRRGGRRRGADHAACGRPLRHRLVGGVLRNDDPSGR